MYTFIVLCWHSFSFICPGSYSFIHFHNHASCAALQLTPQELCLPLACKQYMLNGGSLWWNVFLKMDNPVTASSTTSTPSTMATKTLTAAWVAPAPLQPYPCQHITLNPLKTQHFKDSARPLEILQTGMGELLLNFQP